MTGNLDRIRRQIRLNQSFGLTLEGAGRELIDIGASPAAVEQAIEMEREEAQRRILLTPPNGATELEYERIIGEARSSLWYGGPDDEIDQYWPATKARIGPGLGEALGDVNTASTKVVGLTTNPGMHGLRKKGLVLGYVQSGKTANYTSVMAKAADRGYRLFIVLSGIHNALRAQTQARLERDLTMSHAHWVRFTTTEADFGGQVQGAGFLAASQTRNLIVIKKNAARLKRLRDWLHSMDVDVRRSCPALFLDDEADQATPNSMAARREQSRINALLREIFELLPTATYLGYTATPFANIFMEAWDEKELYPSDFIVDLPRPDRYFGAERLFGVSNPDDADEDFDGLDAIRKVPTQEAASLTPPTKTDEREGWLATAAPSLEEALLWFLVATAIRGARGDQGHSSMLVHNTRYTIGHHATAAVVRQLLEAWKADPSAAIALAEAVWESEVDRVPPADFGNQRVNFEDLRPYLLDTIEEVRVVVDNGTSTDRLNYDADREIVVAVGGDTLSRGLTLEGLTVSYFIRTSGTYDSLMQMGRWFGYRPGYEDLVRIWTTDELKARFRFLAFVEQEIRSEIEGLEASGQTPRQLAVRVRTHPAMSVTAPSKMHFADEIEIAYGGRRLQTFRFDELDADVLRHNLDAARNLVQASLPVSTTQRSGQRRILTGVPKDIVLRFFRDYRVYRNHGGLDPDRVVDYLDTRVDEAAQEWNVAVLAGPGKPRQVGDRLIDLGSVDLGFEAPIAAVNRAPLVTPQNFADVKAIMSKADRFLDLPDANVRIGSRPEHELQEEREQIAQGRGLLVLYPISRHSVPMSAAAIQVGSRRDMAATEDLLGFGVIFPAATAAERIGDGGFVSLPLVHEAVDEPDEQFELALLSDDSEATHEVEPMPLDGD